MKHAKLAVLMILVLVAGLLAAVPVGATHGETGNGAPNGRHYTLNIIGVPQGKTADMTGSNRHTIFVSLEGRTKINLCEAGTGDPNCPATTFQVLDGNATDGPALFALPRPVAEDIDAENQTQFADTIYSVFARPLGKPGGSARITTCAFDTQENVEVCLTDDPAAYLELTRGKGKSTFQNVSGELLFVTGQFDDDAALERLPLFDERLQGFFWDYNNNRLKLAQLRFYPCSSVVDLEQNGDGSFDPEDDTACFSGDH